MTLDQLVENKVKWLAIHTKNIDLTFDLAALQAIQRESTGDITLTAVQAANLSGDALAAIGSRPAYSLAVNYTNTEGNDATVPSFGTGLVTIGLAYAPVATEQAENLSLVYVDAEGNVEWLSSSGYEENSGNVTGTVGYFSLFGVGYKSDSIFTDIEGHWAKEDINFAVSRGLFAGTSDTTFTPNGTVTRGMFVTVLGRLAGVDTSSYDSSNRFADVPTDAYYAPFVEWAADKGIVNGTDDTHFSPDTAITREQMARIMQMYAEKLGYTLPLEKEIEHFADSQSISNDAFQKAVQAMQQAGVMSGKDDNLFAPKDSATRAEAAAVLSRFVKLVIDPGTSAIDAQ